MRDEIKLKVLNAGLQTLGGLHNLPVVWEVKHTAVTWSLFSDTPVQSLNDITNSCTRRRLKVNCGTKRVIN